MRRSGMTWTLLTYIRDSIRDERIDRLLKEGIPQELIDMVRSMSLDDIEDLDCRHPNLFPAVIEGGLLRVLVEAFHNGASEQGLRDVAEKWRMEHPYGSNVLSFPPPKK